MSSGLFDIGAKRGPVHPQPAPQFPVVLIEPKQPQAADPQAPSLACLGDEIITIIADLLQDTSPQATSSLALVCSAYHRIVRYTQHRELVLGNSARKLDYVTRSGILQAVRKLEVHSDIFLSQLCELIPKMTGLKHIMWPNIPKPIIRLLRPRPSIRIHTEITDRWNPKNLSLLRENKNVASLKVSIPYNNAEECLRWTKPLKRVILSCPNIRKLSLNIHLRQDGYQMHMPPLEYCGFGFVDGEHPPALEELELEAYPFGICSPDHPRPNNFTIHSRGYPLRVHEMDYWQSHFDWSKLRRLTIRDSGFAMKIMPQLTSLESIGGFRNSGSTVIHGAFSLVPSSLRSIGAPKIADVGLENLLRHGNTLRSLTIHQDEDYEGRWRHETINAETLIKIRDRCPHIEELNLDISRNGDWPYEMLDILASFNSLRSLTIWFELGLDSRSKPVKPYVTFSAVGRLFQYLREHAASQNTRLRKATFISGSAPRVVFDVISKEAYWASSNSSRFVCTLSDRDDGVKKGVFNVTCANQGQLENEYLWRHAAGEKHIAILRSLSEPLLIARDGPIPLPEWIL
ncbi:hypothetical protein F5Y02DRAFT_401963 [Annulohypoxylon stygium]|nr:hypothetical protein F5Y02DRAFT_401963 [Annulohypoxylon stygium]